MRERRQLRSIWFLLLLTVALCGCTPTGSGTSTARGGDDLLGADAPKLNAPLRGDVEPDASDALAEQAQRDVDDFLRMRQEAQANAASEEFPVAETRPQPPMNIVWNDPTPDRTGAVEGLDGAAAEPEFQQSPLFRDPAEAIEVADPPAAEEKTGSPLTEDHLDLLLVELRREVFPRSTYSDQPLRELLFLAAMSIIDPDSPLNPEAFRDLSEEERALLATFQQFFADLGRKLDGSVEAEEAIVNAVLQLRKSLVQEPELRLPAAEMCWRIDGFGDYDAFDRCAFLAHAEQQFILYLEFEGFTSELNKKDQWVTEISQQLEIISDRDGIPVWSETWRKAVDVTSKQRRDFFTTQIVTLPKALSVGKYQLKIRTRDEKSGAEAEASIDFEMVADEKLAAKVPE